MGGLVCGVELCCVCGIGLYLLVVYKVGDCCFVVVDVVVDVGGIEKVWIVDENVEVLYVLICDFVG